MNSLRIKLEAIKEHIAAGETPLAVQELLVLSKPTGELREYAVDIILLANRLEVIKSNEIRGLVTYGSESRNTLNFSILNLLDQIQANLRQEDIGSVVENRVSELTRDLLTAKGTHEVGKIMSSAEKLDKQSPDNSAVRNLLEKVTKSLVWEKKQEEDKDYKGSRPVFHYPPYSQGDYSGNHSSSWFLVLLLVAILLYFVLRGC